MGLFSTVEAELSCLRCGATFVRPASPPNAAYLAHRLVVPSRHNSRVDTLMRERGWPLGSDPFVEPNVVVATEVRVDRDQIG